MFIAMMLAAARAAVRASGESLGANSLMIALVVLRSREAKAQAMKTLIEEVRKDRDSIGGVCELVATGVPAGLGEPVFDKLKADLAKGLLSLPAVMAFEYGAGFAVATNGVKVSSQLHA